MPAGWQRSNGELVSLLRFLLFISSLSIFCLVNLVNTEFEIRMIFFFGGIYVIAFGVGWPEVEFIPWKIRRSGILGTESLLRSFAVGNDVLGCSGLHRVTSCPQSSLSMSLNPLIPAGFSSPLPAAGRGGSAPCRGCGELLKSGVQKIAAHYSCDKGTVQCSFPLYPPNNNT